MAIKDGDSSSKDKEWKGNLQDGDRILLKSRGHTWSCFVKTTSLQEFLNRILWDITWHSEIKEIRWMESCITPLYKGANKDRSKAENFQSISFTSITCKMEHVVQSHRQLSCSQQHQWQRRRIGVFQHTKFTKCVE